jgi:hypothetical protein
MDRLIGYQWGDLDLVDLCGVVIEIECTRTIRGLGDRREKKKRTLIGRSGSASGSR